MKKLLFLIAVILIGFSCKKKVEVIQVQTKIDPNATILIRPALQNQTRSIVTDLSNREIVENAMNIVWQSHWFGDVFWDDVKFIARGFAPQHKDIEKEQLRMWATDVIDVDGNYRKTFTYGFSLFIIGSENDTLAYIPDEIINAARIKIEEAFNNENYDEVYDLFNTAFTFLPIESE